MEQEKVFQIRHWQKLLSNCKIGSLSSLSIVAPEMGATYPLNFRNFRLKDMYKYKGAYGEKMNNCSSWNSLFLKMPSYVIKGYKAPEWLRESIIYTRELYKKIKILE